MDRKRSLYGQMGSGIPKPATRPSAYSALDSGIPKPRSTLVPQRQSSGYGLSRPSHLAPFSAVKSAIGSARKSIFQNPFMSARKSHTPQNGRPSFNPSSVTSTASRQSIGGIRPIQEDRPVSDTAYHKQCVTKLNNFLQILGHQPMPARFFASPSSSDIRRAFELLFRELGIDLSQVASNPNGWDNEVPSLMRSLGYKYTINKKFVLGSTSNNAKGQLFGMLEWLVDALSYSARSDVQHILYQRQENGPLDVGLELFKVSLHCNDPDEVEERLVKIGDKLYGTEEQLQQMVRDEDAIKKEIIQLDQEIREADERRRLLNEVESECVNFQKWTDQLSEQLESHRKTAAEEIPQLQQKITESENLRQQLLTEKNRINSLLSEQKFGQEDLKWARERQQQLKEEAERVGKAIEEFKRNLRDVKLSLKKEEDKLFKMQNEIHSWLMSLKEALHSPTLAPYVGKIRESMQSKNFESACQFLVQPIDLTPAATEKRKELQELIQEQKMLLVQQKVVLDGSVLNGLQQKLNDWQKEIAEREKAVQIVKDKLKALNDELENEKMEATQEHNRLKNEYESNQKFLKELGNKLKKSESETADRVQKLADDVSKLALELKDIKLTRIQWVKNHTEDQKKILTDVVHDVETSEQSERTTVEELDKMEERYENKMKKMHDRIQNYKSKRKPSKR